MSRIDREEVDRLRAKSGSCDVADWLPEFEKEITRRLRERAPDFVLWRIVGTKPMRNRWRARWTDRDGDVCEMESQGGSFSAKDALLGAVAEEFYQAFDRHTGV